MGLPIPVASVSLCDPRYLYSSGRLDARSRRRFPDPVGGSVDAAVSVEHRRGLCLPQEGLTFLTPYRNLPPPHDLGWVLCPVAIVQVLERSRSSSDSLLTE